MKHEKQVPPNSYSIRVTTGLVEESLITYAVGLTNNGSMKDLIPFPISCVPDAFFTYSCHTTGVVSDKELMYLIAISPEFNEFSKLFMFTNKSRGLTYFGKDKRTRIFVRGLVDVTPAPLIPLELAALLSAVPETTALIQALPEDCACHYGAIYNYLLAAARNIPEIKQKEDI